MTSALLGCAMAFTLAQLRLVRAVSELGSLGKASAALGVTQPALSRSLKELERQLGIPLFDRLPSGLRPTRFCDALLPYAANAIEESTRGLEEIRILAGASQEVVRIGAVSSLTASLIPALIRELIDSYPDICVKVTEGVDEVLVGALLAHEVDAIICGPIPESDEITRALDLGFGDVCTLLVGADHPFRGRTEVSMAELLDQRRVALPRDTMPRKFFDQLARSHGLAAPAVTVETRSVNLIRKLVAHQGFITWGPTPLYVSTEAGSEIFALDLPPFRLQRPFFVYRLRRAAMSGALRRALPVLQRLAAAQTSAAQGGHEAPDSATLAI